MASASANAGGSDPGSSRKERSPPPSSSTSGGGGGGAGNSGPLELPHDPRRLYVFGLPEAVKEADLTDMFSRFGKVHIMRIIYDHVTGKTKGYAFITMETEAMGQEIIRQAQQGALQLEGRPLRVEQARGRSDHRNRDGDRGGSYERRPYSPQRRLSPRRDDDRRPPRDAYDDRRDRYADDRYRRDDYRPAYPASSSSSMSASGYTSRGYYPPPPSAYPADPYYRDRYAAPPPPSSAYGRDGRDPYPPRDPRDYRDPYPAAPARTYPPPSSSAYAPAASYPPPPPPQAAYYDSRYDYARRQDDPRRDMRRDDRGAPPPVGSRPPPYPERYDDRRK